MNHPLSSNTAIKILLGFFSIVTVFHLLILLKWIPYSVTWGGRLKNDEEMYVFEIISITIILALIWVILMKGKLINPILSEKTLNLILWISFILFVLNTIGNLFAKTVFEKGFSILTLITSLLIWIVIKKK